MDKPFIQNLGDVDAMANGSRRFTPNHRARFVYDERRVLGRTNAPAGGGSHANVLKQVIDYVERQESRTSLFAKAGNVVVRVLLYEAASSFCRIAANLRRARLLARIGVCARFSRTQRKA